MGLSKTTRNFANKRNVELCECFGNEIHLIANPEFNDSASCAYIVQKDGSLELALHWDDSIVDLPKVISNEIELRKVVDAVAKSDYMNCN